MSMLLLNAATVKYGPDRRPSHTCQAPSELPLEGWTHRYDACVRASAALLSILDSALDSVQSVETLFCRRIDRRIDGLAENSCFLVFIDTTQQVAKEQFNIALNTIY